MEEIKEEKVLEKRMYFFTLGNISNIYKGIQAGHSCLRYARLFSKDHPEVWDFVDNHETWIILNGGSTNSERDFDGVSKGTLNQIANQLLDNDIRFSYFMEPDLDNALTAVCFLLDERVFNRKDYPDFLDYLVGKLKDVDETDFGEITIAQLMTNDDLITSNPKDYKSWVRSIGGIKNVFLRELIKGKKLA